MAKKKMSHSSQEKPLPKHEDFVKADYGLSQAMDSEALEKLEHLKSLNQKLLKEAFDRRKQVEALLKDKEMMGSELSGMHSDMEVLREELRGLGEEVERCGIERNVVALFVAQQVGQKGEVVEGRIKGLESEMRELKDVILEKDSEIWSLSKKLSEVEGRLVLEREVSGRVCAERDEVKGKLEMQIEECEGLIDNVIESEEKKRKVELAMEKLRVEFDSVLVEKKELESRIETMTGEKDSIERRLLESNKVMEELKRKLNVAVKEKEGIEKEKNIEVSKVLELEDAVSGFKVTVASLQREGEALRATVSEMKKKGVEDEEMKKVMRMEIDRLIQELDLSEKAIESVTDEKILIDKDLSEKLEKLDIEREKVGELTRQNTFLEQSKRSLDSEVAELQNQVVELKANILELEGASSTKLGTITSLESEVLSYRSALEKVEVERDEIKNCRDEEKRNTRMLEEQIEEKENKIEECLKVAKEMKTNNAAIRADNKELETQCQKMKKEIRDLENVLNETRNELEAMKGRVELAESKSKHELNLLKETAEFCKKDDRNANDDDLLRGKNMNGDETKTYTTELEAIRNAFKLKETKVENMNRQLEFLQKSVAVAHKRKNFWTMLSSATTVLAAASLAFIVHGH